VAPVARLLAASGLSERERSDLSAAFFNALQNLHGDEASFAAESSGIYEGSSLVELAKLVKKLDAANVPIAPATEVLRTYVVSNLSGTQCLGRGAGSDKHDQLPPPAWSFNALFGPFSRRVQIRPITPAELKPNKTVPSRAVNSLWRTPTSSRLADNLRRIKFGDSDSASFVSAVPAALAFRWRARESDLMSELLSWSGSDEAQTDVFHEKSILYLGLVDIAPSADEKIKLIGAFVKFLDQHSYEQTSPMEWLWYVQRLLITSSTADERQAVVDALVSSENDTLNLYGQLERQKP
jgi:hypothetical protein